MKLWIPEWAKKLLPEHMRGTIATYPVGPDEEEQVFVPANRRERRAQQAWMKKRGAGYTRSYRKGRTQRHA